jgi:hypothetical protein
MTGPIAELLVADHERIGALLFRAGAGERAAYEEVRARLLRHIGLEEKILLPALRARGADVTALAVQLRLDHAALAAMLVPPATPALISEITALLALHDPLEESADGLYARADELLAREPAILERLKGAAAPPLARHFDGPRAYASIAALVARARAAREST